MTLKKKGLKTLWDREKMLMTSIFFFSEMFPATRKRVLKLMKLFVRRQQILQFQLSKFYYFVQKISSLRSYISNTKTLLKSFPKKPWFLCVCSTSLLKTLWEKKDLFITRNFSFSQSVFYLFGELSSIFMKTEIVLCKLFQFGRV